METQAKEIECINCKCKFVSVGDDICDDCMDIMLDNQSDKDEQYCELCDCKLMEMEGEYHENLCISCYNSLYGVDYE